MDPRNPTARCLFCPRTNGPDKPAGEIQVGLSHSQGNKPRVPTPPSRCSVHKSNTDFLRSLSPSPSLLFLRILLQGRTPYRDNEVLGCQNPAARAAQDPRRAACKQRPELNGQEPELKPCGSGLPKPRTASVGPLEGLGDQGPGESQGHAGTRRIAQPRSPASSDRKPQKPETVSIDLTLNPCTSKQNLRNHTLKKKISPFSLQLALSSEIFFSLGHPAVPAPVNYTLIKHITLALKNISINRLVISIQ